MSERKLRLSAEAVRIGVHPWGIFINGETIEKYIQKAFGNFCGDINADIDFYIDEVDISAKIDSDFIVEEEKELSLIDETAEIKEGDFIISTCSGETEYLVGVVDKIDRTGERAKVWCNTWTEEYLTEEDEIQTLEDWERAEKDRSSGWMYLDDCRKLNLR